MLKYYSKILPMMNFNIHPLEMTNPSMLETFHFISLRILSFFNQAYQKMSRKAHELKHPFNSKIIAI